MYLPRHIHGMGKGGRACTSRALCTHINLARTREAEQNRTKYRANRLSMAGEGKADAQLFQLLSNLLQQVEALTNQEEVELRSKIEALGLEVTKVPSTSTQLDELEIARELDKLSAKLDDVDEMISSAIAADPQVQSLLSGTADIWMPVITATADERRDFTGKVADDTTEAKGRSFS